MNENKEISDLALATFLSVTGHKLSSTPRTSGRKAIFIFEASEKLEKDILAFYNRTARVDPIGFAETFRNLKALVL
jgi:hypothetical protein